MNNDKIEIVLSSDGDYEKLTAEILVDGKFVALLSQEEGVENLNIEFPATGLDESALLRTVPLTVLERAITMAREKLIG